MKSEQLAIADEAITYLYRQIDPRERANPRYAAINAQIDAICRAKVALTPMSKMIMSREQYELFIRGVT